MQLREKRMDMDRRAREKNAFLEWARRSMERMAGKGDLANVVAT